MERQIGFGKVCFLNITQFQGNWPGLPWFCNTQESFWNSIFFFKALNFVLLGTPSVFQYQGDQFLRITWNLLLSNYLLLPIAKEITSSDGPSLVTINYSISGWSISEDHLKSLFIYLPTICYCQFPKNLSHIIDLRWPQWTIDKFFAELGHCVSGGTKLESRNWIEKFGLNLITHKILLLKCLPQVSEFFLICLVCPTFTHCCHHWTRRCSPRGTVC